MQIPKELKAAAVIAAKAFNDRKAAPPPPPVAPALAPYVPSSRSSASASSSSNHDPSVALSLAAVTNGTRSAPAPEPVTITVSIIIPGELSVNREDTAATVRVPSPTSLLHLHETLVKRNVIIALEASFSVKSDEDGGDRNPGGIDMAKTIGEIVQGRRVSSAASSALTLIIYPVIAVLNVFVKHADHEGRLMLKVKPGQRCERLMKAVCKHFKETLETAQFAINGIVIRANQSFQDAGVQNEAEIVVSHI
jgi:hypothetical protein